MLELNTKSEKVIPLDFETLRATQPENDVEGKPIGGLRHWDIIADIMNVCEDYGYETNIRDMWAANNRDSFRPGISLLPEMVVQYGETAPQSHIIRRVYTTITLGDNRKGEYCTAIAIAFQQMGVQIAIGPNVHICHNQSVLSADDMISNFGPKKIRRNNSDFSESPQPFYRKRLDTWMENLLAASDGWNDFIKEMRTTILSRYDINQWLGELYSRRITNDLDDKEIPKPYAPFTHSQLNRFSEGIIESYFRTGEMDAWKFANHGTNIFKPKSADMPTILPSNAALFDFIKEKL